MRNESCLAIRHGPSAKNCGRLPWVVGGNVEGVVRDPKAKGITFEHYDMPDMKREGDIHIGGDMKVAWFKDPDGNILNIVSG